MTKRRRHATAAPTQSAGDEDGGANNEPPLVDRPATRSPKEYVNLPYQIALRADERNGGWTAQVEELPGCQAHGDSPEQAARRLRGAMEEWVGAALGRGEDVPEPRSLSGHSGRLLLRMPQSLHAELAHAADAEGISLNQLITTALASAVGWRNRAEGHRRIGSPPGEAKPSAPTGNGSRPRTRARNIVLTANLILLLVVAAFAVILLLRAWHRI
jgi:predicted RNase H-like HicB family nuclease